MERRMKTIITLGLLLATTLTYSQTVQDANDLYNLRGEDTLNAKKAADMYGSLAQSESDPMKKGSLLTIQGLAIYYYAVRQPSENTREALHKNAFEIADKAIIMLSKEKSKYGATPLANTAEAKKLLAEAHYVSAINMGKWAEARGLFASLSEWKHMRAHLEAVTANDETVAWYGAFRTFGRAWLKLPFTHGGSKKKSLRDLEKAYNNTFSEDFGTSTNPTTTVFYLDTLVEVKEKGDKFCDAYYGFSDLMDLEDEDILELNPELLPEFKTEFENFKNLKDFKNDVHTWADANC